MQIVSGKVVTGYGVASGRNGDARFPDGTLALQWPYFMAGGLDLEGIFRGTINISVAPLKPEPNSALKTFRKVAWHDSTPPEDFSFFQVRVALVGEPPVAGYIYWPHPETKPEHFQNEHVVEVLASGLDGIVNDVEVQLWSDPTQMAFV